MKVAVVSEAKTTGKIHKSCTPKNLQSQTQPVFHAGTPAAFTTLRSCLRELVSWPGV
jgi:hypothetical protein